MLGLGDFILFLRVVRALRAHIECLVYSKSWCEQSLMQYNRSGLRRGWGGLVGGGGVCVCVGEGGRGGLRPVCCSIAGSLISLLPFTVPRCFPTAPSP